LPENPESYSDADRMVTGAVKYVTASAETSENSESRSAAGELTEGPADIGRENRDDFMNASANAQLAAGGFASATEPLRREAKNDDRDQASQRRPYVSPYDAYRFNGGTRPIPGAEPAGDRQSLPPGAGPANQAQPGIGQPTERAYGNPAMQDGQAYPSWRTQSPGMPYGRPGYGPAQPAGNAGQETFAGNGGAYNRDRTAGENAFSRKEPYTANNGGGFGPSGPNDPEKPKKKGGKGKKIAAILGLAALFGLVAALVFFGVNRLMGGILQHFGTSTSVTPVPEPPKVIIGSNGGDTESRQPAGRSDIEEGEGSLEKLPEASNGASWSDELSVPDVVELTMPSMVAITNTSISEYRSLFGERGQYENVSTGSGIVVGETDTDFLIATNDHVISDANKITVTFIDDSVVEGEVSASDNRNDLAIVSVKKDKIEKETLEQIRIIAIGNSDELRVGETVIAIGNALGYGQSVSCGVVSALNRTVSVDGITHELIQTDASINPGNSGGALINLRGELIGINEVKAVDTKVEGVGYAIPMATAKPILENLGTKAARTKVDDEHASYIGIHCMTMSNYYVQMGYPAGAYVSDVMKDGPAEAAGLKEGDIITAIDGSNVTTSTQLITYLEYYAAGEKVNFTVKRLNEAQNGFDVLDIEITLGNKNDANFEAPGEVG
ncbi:MAG: S1C family serine protease, partial [bacterium]